MGSGRLPKPTALKVLEGNPGGRALNKHEPKGKRALHEPPEWMDGMHRAVWYHALQEAPPGLLTSMDEAALAAYVTAYITHQRATEELCTSGLLMDTLMGGVKANPLVQIQTVAARTMLRAAAEMGFTPSSRSRVVVNEQAQEDGAPRSPFAVFAGGRRA